MARLLVLLMLIVPTAARAQGGPASIVLDQPRFDSWVSAPGSIAAHAVRLPAPSPHRFRNAIIGGAIGAVAGAIVCTAISNIADDAAVNRFTTCTTSGYLLTGGIGFGAGFLIGWLGSS